VCNRWKSDQHFLEREIDRLFALGCASPEGLLDVDSFRVVVHALDPFELESNIAAMHREADIQGTSVAACKVVFRTRPWCVLQGTLHAHG
jgi:hypothetical protein